MRLFVCGASLPLLLLLLLVASGLSLFSATISTIVLAGEPSDGIAARVDGVPVTVAEVARFRSRHLMRDKAQDSERDWLDAVALRQLVHQRLVVGWLARHKQGATDDEINAAVARLKKQAELRKQPFEQHIEADYGDEESLRRELAWRLGWAKFIAREATDKALEAFFEANRRQFDGTTLRVSHILWKIDSNDESARDKAVAAASEVRRQIVSGSLTFPEAVAHHSQAPSRDQQGDLGFISRHGEMHEAFARAAFELEPGETSPPIVTPHGVHLIHCTDVRPGNKTLADVRDRVQERYALHRFEQIVAQQEKRAKIEILRVTPYFHPEHGKLVVPDH
jgi:parvulin-like peptidyl-prolyl isomerase